MCCLTRPSTILIVTFMLCALFTGCSGQHGVTFNRNVNLNSSSSSVHNLIDRATSPLWLVDKGKPESGKTTIEIPKNQAIEPAEYQGTPGWARTWGGGPGGNNSGNAIAVDVGGNVYVTGFFTGRAVFNTNPGQRVMTIDSVGGTDVFLSKFDSKGNFVWVKTWGGPSTDMGEGVSVGQAGNVYVTGFFSSNVDFNPDAKAYDWHASYGGYDAFLTRFDKDGTYYWTKTWGGWQDDTGDDVAAKGLFKICVVGSFQNEVNNQPVDFDPGAGFDSHISNGEEDAYLTMFDYEGNHLGVRTWGGAQGDYAHSVALDKNEYAYVTGAFFSNDLDFSAGLKPGGYLASPNGGSDIYLSKFDKYGNHIWTRTWGAEGHDGGDGVAVDPNTGDAYVTGSFWRTVDFSVGQKSSQYTLTSVDDTDGFLSKFNPNGDFQWAKTFGGNDQDNGTDVVVTKDSKIYVTGYFIADTALNLGGGNPFMFLSKGETDAHLCKFNSNGGFEWGLRLGGPGRDRGIGLAVDPINGVYMTGWFGGVVNFATEGIDNHTSRGDTGAYLCSYPSDGEWGPKLKLIPGEKFQKFEIKKK